MLLRLVLLAALANAASAASDVVSERPDAITVTIYHDDGVSTSDLIHSNGDWVRNEGLGFITETRTIDLPAGPSVVQLRGVVSTIVPQTAEIQGLPAGVAEQNFDYDLLTPGSLLAKSIGETVHLVRTDPKTGKKAEATAIVRSAPSGTFLEIDGTLEALGCNGLPEKLVFDKIPEGLTDTPTLSVRTLAPTAGHYTIKLSYIATGLNWSADYVAHIASDGRSLDLSGWLTLANFSDNGFHSIPIAVVAGRVNTTGDDTPVQPHALAESTQCWPTNIDWTTYARLATLLSPPPPPPAAINGLPQEELQTVVVTGSRVSDPRLLGDYKIYTLPEPATLAAKQTKQIQFLDQYGVAFEKLYRFDVSTWDDAVSHDSDAAAIVLRLKNDHESGLGKPLPAGSVSVMDLGADGAPIFVGQNSVSDTAVGSPFEIEIGRAMDVQAEYRVVDFTKIGSGDKKRSRKSIEVTVSNRKPNSVRFEVRQPMFTAGMRIVSESRAHKVKPDSTAWDFDVSTSGIARLEYVVEYPTP